MRVADVKPVSFIAQLRCDRCGAEARHNVDDGFNNFLQIEFDASWGSVMGDGTHVEVDLCHGCLKVTLGQWLRLSSSAWNRLLDSAELDEPEDLPSQERPPLGNGSRD